MGKIRINLASGNVIEKPLVTCFQGAISNYIVLDNETNGSMGLPVICISRFNNNVAEKITDQNEWMTVKENLKTIISGTTLPYVSVPETITAADDFYTQLTLPLASFDLLKNVYAPAAPAPVEPVAPAAMPVEPVAPVAPVDLVAAPEMPTPIAIPDATTLNIPAAPAPVEPVAPAMPEPVSIEPVSLPQVPESQTVAPSANSDINAIKENFMKSCENMFDALIQQFNIK